MCHTLSLTEEAVLGVEQASDSNWISSAFAMVVLLVSILPRLFEFVTTLLVVV